MSLWSDVVFLNPVFSQHKSESAGHNVLFTVYVRQSNASISIMLSRAIWIFLAIENNKRMNKKGYSQSSPRHLFQNSSYELYSWGWGKVEG